MKHPLGTTEAHSAVLQSKKNLAILVRVVKWSVFGAIAYSAILFLSGITLAGWQVLAVAAAGLGLISLVCYGYAAFKRTLVKDGRHHFVRMLKCMERLLEVFIYMGAGVLLYRAWQVERISTVVLLLLMVCLVIRGSWQSLSKERGCPANGRQPNRSETNQPSGTAGSRPSPSR